MLASSQKGSVMPSYSEDFERFWGVYPRRKGKIVGKGAAYEVWKKLKEGERPKVLRAALNYSRSDLARTGYARDPPRFLRARYWEDWLEDEGDVSERDYLIDSLKKYKGSSWRKTVIVEKGLEGMHAVMEWHEFPTEKLREILSDLEVRTTT
jgi:hypothetical protein